MKDAEEEKLEKSEGCTWPTRGFGGCKSPTKSCQRAGTKSCQALSPVSMQAHTPASVQIQSPANEQALSLVSVQENTSKSQKDLEKGNKQNEFTNNVSQKEHENGKTIATCIDLVLRQSTQSLNACQIIFGSYHQNDVRFSEQSRGFQCTGNALCMLSYSACLDINNSSTLDKIFVMEILSIKR